MQNGVTLFMSRRTKTRIKDELFSDATPVLDSLEYPMNFEAFVSTTSVLICPVPGSVSDRSTFLFCAFPLLGSFRDHHQCY